TLRLPVKDPGFTEADLLPITQKVRNVFEGSPTTPPARSPTPAPGPAPVGTSVDDLGKELCQVALPQQVAVELSTAGLFLEIVTDEAYQDYPWELMHDGNNFYCLRHYIGRYVNVSQVFASAGLAAGNAANTLGPFHPLRVFVICADE